MNNHSHFKLKQNEKANQKTQPQQEDDFKSKQYRDESTSGWR
jgi:hypothetical protein